MTILHIQCTSHLLLMILIIISCDYLGSVHSDVDDGRKEEDYEEGDKGKKSLDESEEAHI